LPLCSKEKQGWPWENASSALSELMPHGSQWPKISIVTSSFDQVEYIVNKWDEEYGAKQLVKPRMQLPILNKSGREKNDLKRLPEKVSNEFRANNELDYFVYDYC